MIESGQISLGQATTKPGFGYANLTAIAPPTVSDDETLGYSKNSIWYDTESENVFLCVNASEGAAIWKIIRYVPSSFDSAVYTVSGNINYNEQIVAEKATSIALNLLFSATTVFSVILKNIGEGNATFISDAGETFSGLSSLVLGSGETAVLQSTGTNWIRTL